MFRAERKNAAQKSHFGVELFAAMFKRQRIKTRYHEAKLTGTVIGTTGSWDGVNTRACFLITSKLSPQKASS